MEAIHAPTCCPVPSYPLLVNSRISAITWRPFLLDVVCARLDTAPTASFAWSVHKAVLATKWALCSAGGSARAAFCHPVTASGASATFPATIPAIISIEIPEFLRAAPLIDTMETTVPLTSGAT